jgi:hypothetical protein
MDAPGHAIVYHDRQQKHETFLPAAIALNSKYSIGFQRKDCKADEAGSIQLTNQIFVYEEI